MKISFYFCHECGTSLDKSNDSCGNCDADAESGPWLRLDLNDQTRTEQAEKAFAQLSEKNND